jgi:hypothetical protein
LLLSFLEQKTGVLAAYSPATKSQLTISASTAALQIEIRRYGKFNYWLQIYGQPSD